MNRNLLFVSFILLLFSCSEKAARKESEQVQIKSVNTVIDPKQQKIESLKSSAPMDLEVLKNLLPLTMNDIKRSHYSVSNSMGYGLAHADYEKNSKTDIRVTFYDCSGEAGAGIFESVYWNRLNQTKEDETSTLRTIDLSGARALEKFDKDTKVTTITFLVNEKILAVISGRNIDPAVMKDNIAKMEFSIN
jgi:hypothetical protein